MSHVVFPLRHACFTELFLRTRVPSPASSPLTPDRMASSARAPSSPSNAGSPDYSYPQPSFFGGRAGGQPRRQIVPRTRARTDSDLNLSVSDSDGVGDGPGVAAAVDPRLSPVEGILDPFGPNLSMESLTFGDEDGDGDVDGAVPYDPQVRCDCVWLCVW